MSATTVPLDADAPAATAPPRRRRRLLAITLGLVLLVGGAAAAYLFLLQPADGVAASAEPVEEGAIVEVGTLTTNLAGDGARYARVGIALVLTAEADAAAVTERFPLVKDAALAEIGGHDPAALHSEAGTTLLRDGLTARIQQVYPDGEVVRVALTELLVQ